MKRAHVLVVAVASLWLNSIARGHGIPIDVSVDANNKLVAANSQPLYSASNLQTGYAPMILVDNEDAAVMDSITIDSAALNLHGQYEFTTLPGFNVTGVDPNSGLYLQVIPRPVKGTNLVTGRLLWHWSLSGGAVALDPAGESLVVASDADNVVQQISVPQSNGASISLKVADPMASELGTHQHYLEYLLENPPAETGLYGFFARLTSPNYGSSNPFLVILDDGVYEDDNPGKILAGALAINNAALLAGDYNHDDRVDAADYVVWRSSLNSTTQLAADGSGNSIVDMADYTVWRNNFGLTFNAGGAGGLGSGAAVPEPSAAATVMILLGCYRFRARRRD